MLKRWLCLLTILYPFLVPAQQPTRTMEGIIKMSIDDDETYSPKLEHPAYEEDGPLVLLDEGHGNAHFDKAFAKLISMDGYRVLVSPNPLKYDDLSKAKVLVIMNAGSFMTRVWYENPQPLFSDVEAAAVRDWVAAGGSLLFASGSAKPESGEMLLNHLGVEFNHDILSDRDLTKPSSSTQPPFEPAAFTREKKMFSSHSIMAGRSESERVDVVAVDGFSVILKSPNNAVALFHCSDKAVIIPRDWLLKKQMAEAERALLKTSPATESQPVTTQVLSTVPAPGVPVAVAFALGKGRVVILGNGSALSSILRQFVVQGQPVSQKAGLDNGDNQKFTLNIMHWLTGLLE